MDIGARTVKVLAATGGRGLCLTDFAITYLPADETPEAKRQSIIRAVKELFEEKKLSKARVLLTHPAHKTTLRILALPFSESDRINKTLYFEVEPYLPYPIEEAILNYEKIEESPQKSLLLVASAKKQDLKQELEMLAECGIDPQAIVLDSFALHQVLEKSEYLRQEGTLLLLDLGALSTKIMIYQAGDLRFLRALRIGCDDVTRAISRRLGITFDEAQEIKHNFPGLGGSLTAPEDQASAKAFTEYLDKITTEVRRCLLSAGLGEGLKEVLLLGGGSLVKGACHYLEENLGAATQRLKLNQGLEFELSQEEKETLAVFGGPALGLAILQAEKDPFEMGFRRGELRYKRKFEQLRKPLLLGACLLLAIFLMLSFSLKTRISTIKKRATQVKTEMATLWKSAYPSLPVPQDVASVLQAKLGEFRGKSVTEETATAYRSALESFREFMAQVPRDVDFSMKTVDVSPDGMRIEALTSSFATAERIAQSVSRSESLLATPKNLQPAAGGKISFLLEVKFRSEADEEK